MACGLVFGGPAGVALAQWMGVSEMLSPDETVLMGSAAASLAAWWVLGVLDPDRRPGRARPDALTAGGSQARGRSPRAQTDFDTNKDKAMTTDWSAPDGSESASIWHWRT
jgi:hypothetical protein